MADVAEHDAEEKGEGDNCEEGGVGLHVIGYSVGLHDLLGRGCKSIGLEMSRHFLSSRGNQLPHRLISAAF